MFDHYTRLFNKFDEDGSGSIDVEELAQMMQDIGNDATTEELREIISDFDKDQNGVIDFEEFVAIFVSFDLPLSGNKTD